MRKVLFIDSVHPILNERLVKAGFECINGTKFSLEEIQSILPEIFGLVIRSRFTMNVEFLVNGHQLKFIARSGSGLENIDQNYCKEKRIILFNSPEGNRNAVVDIGQGGLCSQLLNIKAVSDWEAGAIRISQLRLPYI